MEKLRNYTQPVSPSYVYMFNFEEKFSHYKTREWMLNNWTSGFYFCGIYVLIIFSLQLYMKDRPKNNLRKILVIWNSCLAVFSIVGASRTLPELLHVTKNFGIYHSVCIQSFSNHNEFMKVCNLNISRILYFIHFMCKILKMTFGKTESIIMNSNFRENVTSITPSYSYMFAFEQKFSPEKARAWMDSNWINGFYYCGIYVLIVFSMKHYMQDRPRFNLKKVLVLWNTLLATFSIVGATRTLPELFHVLSHYGVYHSVCIPSFIESDRVAGFWTWMFALSKLPELGDTIFVVLRKQPLIFLHWYHHITVLLYTWYAYKEYTSSARWFIVMNYCVHSLMYSYYALRAMGFFPPKFIMMLITSLQIAQMVTGCLVNYWSYIYLKSGQACHISILNIQLSTCMYFSYFVLFGRFFYKSYLSPSGKKQPSSIPGSIYTSNKEDKKYQ